jgi:phosphoglycerol transferase MdoB-like AlkP superfamily enzyme
MKKEIKTIIIEYFFEVLALFLLVFSMAFLWQNNLILTSLYILIFLIAIFLWKSKEDILLFIIACIFFQIGEIIIVHYGAWTFNNPTYLGIPIWITLSWGFASVILKRFANTTNKLFRLFNGRNKK